MSVPLKFHAARSEGIIEDGERCHGQDFLRCFVWRPGEDYMRDSERYLREHQTVEEKKGCGDLAMSSNGRESLAFSMFLFLLVSACDAQAPSKFRCGVKNKCQALAGFVPVADTTYEAIRALFQVGSIYDLYGANGLNETTPTSTKVPANATVRVPFPCACANGTGISDRKPVYTSKKGDSLLKIAGETFGGLVTHEQIAAANGIINASSLVNAGKRLFIPLPCSCDPVDFSAVVHLAHVVKKETNLAEISIKFSTFLDSLLSFNTIPDAKSLVPGQVLDVPLYACSSSYIRSPSPDLRLSVPNGSYALTADNCIKCSCERPAGELFCEFSPDSVENKRLGCSWALCSADYPLSGVFQFGGVSFTYCTGTQCFYAGYDEHLIWTTASTQRYSACGDRPGSNSASVERGLLLGWTLLLLQLLLPS